MANPESKWNWFDGTTAEFIAAHKRGHIIGLVTPGGKASNKVGAHPHGVFLRQCVKLCLSQKVVKKVGFLLPEFIEHTRRTVVGGRISGPTVNTVCARS